MAERNAWAKTADEAEDVEAERVLTLADIAAMPNIVDQIAAIDGVRSPSPLTTQELGYLQTIGAWYSGACATVGVQPPPDLLRAVIACAGEVVSYNMALKEQGDPNAIGLTAPRMQ